MIDVGSDDDVGLHFTRDGGGAEAANFFVCGDGVEDADVFEGLFGEETGEFGDHETAEAVVEVSAVEGVFGEAFADRAIEDDGVAGTDAEFFDFFFGVVSVHLEFEEEHFRFDPFGSGALGWFGEVDGAEGLDSAAVDGAEFAGLVGVLGEEFDLVTDEGAGEEGIAVDPDFSITADAADLQADFIGMADDHDGGFFVITGVGVEDDAGVAFELLDRPGFWFDLFEHGLEDAVAHRSFEADGTGGGEDLAHEVELLGGHCFCPRSFF